MAENDVTIQINLDAKDAQAAIELFGKESAKVLKNTEKQADSLFGTLKNSGKSVKGFFNSIEGAFLPITATITGVVGLFAGLTKAISEATAEARQTKQIEASLRAVGVESLSAVQGILDFADSIKAATGISDDLVKSTFITAQNFGVTTQRAKDLTVAAIDLAAATGEDVDTAVRLLGGTLDGTIGKLGNYGSEFRNLTKEQLEAGAAIDLVAQKFGGAASKDLETFSGRLGQLTNSFGDFLKEIGKLVTESPAVQDALKNTADIINGVTNRIKEAKKEEASRDFNVGASILGVSGAYAEAAVNIRLAADEAKAFADINIGGQSKAVSDGFRGIVEQAQGATSATASLLERFNQFSTTQAPKALELTGKALEDAKKKAEEAAKAFAQLSGKFGVPAEDEIAKIRARYKLERQEVLDFSKKNVEYRSKASKLITQINQNEASDISKNNLEQAKKDADKLRQEAQEKQQRLEGIFQNPFGNLAQNFQAQIVRGIEFAKTGKDIGSPFKEGDIAASISGGLALVLQGKEGARKAISQVGEVIGQSFGIPGLGAITELLSRGPEETKKFIKAFVDSVPDLIIAIAESIPVVVDALVDTLINKGGIVKIAIALVKAMTFAPTLANIGKKIFGESDEKMSQGFREASQQASKNFVDVFKEFINGIGPAFGRFLEELGPAIGRSFDNLGRNLDQSFNRFDDQFNKEIKLFGDQFSVAARSFITGFGNAIADFFSGIGPAFESAINNFVNAITEPFEKLFNPLLGSIQGLSGSFQALDTTFKGIGQIFVDFGNFIKDTFQGLIDAFANLTNGLSRLLDPIERLIKAIDKAFGGGGGKGIIAETYQRAGGGKGGGEGLFRERLKAIGLAKGGLVYAADGFFSPKGTDTVPAMLTPGELVVPRDMVGELGAFLMRQNSDAPTSNDAMLSAIYSAVSSPMVIKTEAKVNQQAFADIILQLNRQNARLSA